MGTVATGWLASRPNVSLLAHGSRRSGADLERVQDGMSSVRESEVNLRRPVMV